MAGIEPGSPGRTRPQEGIQGWHAVLTILHGWDTSPRWRCWCWRSCSRSALMVFNPTLMFERGWEQYVGTAIYFWAVLTLGRELWRLWRNERAFAEAPGCSSTSAARCKRGGVSRAGAARRVAGEGSTPASA